VCYINFYSDNGIKVNSLTGFKVKDCIVTDEFIYKVQKCEEVVFQFVQEDGFTPHHQVRMSFTEFTQRINRLAEFDSTGYAIIEFDGRAPEASTLTIEPAGSSCIGQEIAIIGYHADQDSLCLKKGIVSSFFKAKNENRLIQFDAFIKHGNSGSPLIDAGTGKVIGVVGHRLSSISKTYEAFKSIIDENLKLLKKSEGMMNILDIDPIQVLMANQNQLKQISKEFYKSASMSFGYAHQIHNIGDYIKGLNITHDAETEKMKKETVN